MRRSFITLVATGLLLAGALPAFAQPSPVEEVSPIVVDRPVDRPAVVTPPADRPATVQPSRTVRVAASDQLAQTGIDATTAAGGAALLLIVGGAAVYGARRSASQV